MEKFLHRTFEDSPAANCYHLQMFLVDQIHFCNWGQIGVKFFASVATSLRDAGCF